LELVNEVYHSKRYNLSSRKILITLITVYIYVTGLYVRIFLYRPMSFEVHKGIQHVGYIAIDKGMVFKCILG